MSQIVDKINNSEYIYSTNTKWGLKKYSCDVAYYTEEPLDDLYYVICSILATNEGQYDKRSLGIILGFSMTDFEKEGKHEVYYDVAEVRMFEDILKKVEEEHLIKINETEHLIALTKLGEISLNHLKHYQFFTGTQDVYEHSMLKSELPTAMLMFPFFDDLGIDMVCVLSCHQAFFQGKAEILHLFFRRIPRPSQAHFFFECLPVVRKEVEHAFLMFDQVLGSVAGIAAAQHHRVVILSGNVKRLDQGIRSAGCFPVVSQSAYEHDRHREKQ